MEKGRRVQEVKVSRGEVNLPKSLEVDQCLVVMTFLMRVYTLKQDVAQNCSILLLQQNICMLLQTSAQRPVLTAVYCCVHFLLFH